MPDTSYVADFRWQQRFRGHYAELALGAVRVAVASWDDDARRNTDMMIGTLGNGQRIACRARRRLMPDGTANLRLAQYLRQITIRLSRPTGAETEMSKLRQGWGDFMLYGFEAEPDADRLHPWALLNLALLREYFDRDGRWQRRVNRDGSSDFAAIDVADLPLGAVLNSAGHEPGRPALGPCAVCGRPSWQTDGAGCPLHVCCSGSTPGVACAACDASDRNSNYRYGWPL